MKRCPYCNEEMKYGKYWQVLSFATINGKTVSKKINYEQFGWECNLQTDDCDFVYDESKANENKILLEIAKKTIGRKV